jgi:hypothetical protein
MRQWLRNFWHDVVTCSSGYGGYDPVTRISTCGFCGHVYNPAAAALSLRIPDKP